MVLKFKDEDEVEAKFIETLGILIKLRASTIEWQLHYGAPLANEKKKWEKKADDLLEDLKKRKKIQ